MNQYDIGFRLSSGLPLMVRVAPGDQPVELLCGTTSVRLSESEVARLVDALQAIVREVHR